MAAIKMALDGIVCVHSSVCEHPGLSVRYASLELADLGLEWVFARDVLYHGLLDARNVVHRPA